MVVQLAVYNSECTLHSFLDLLHANVMVTVVSSLEATILNLMYKFSINVKTETDVIEKFATSIFLVLGWFKVELKKTKILN